MKMRQITIEVDVHATADWMDEQDINANKVAFAIQTLLDNMNVGYASVTVTKEQDYR